MPGLEAPIHLGGVFELDFSLLLQRGTELLFKVPQCFSQALDLLAKVVLPATLLLVALLRYLELGPKGLDLRVELLVPFLELLIINDERTSIRVAPRPLVLSIEQLSLAPQAPLLLHELDLAVCLDFFGLQQLLCPQPDELLLLEFDLHSQLVIHCWIREIREPTTRGTGRTEAFSYHESSLDSF